MPEKCCGNCARFTWEDALGFGWCLAKDREKRCDDPACESHEPACESHEPETDDPSTIPA